MNHSVSRIFSRRPGTLKTLLAAPVFACMACVTCAAAFAQNAPVPMPPRLEPLPDSQQPNLSTPAPAIRPGESDKSTGTIDHRDNTGAVVETEVRTPVSHYTVRPNRQVGNAQPGDAQSVGNRAAQFKIGEFGIGRKKTPDDVPQTLEPAPMPPTMPAATPSTQPAKN